uniref:Uncharacterized protein n=1 Tax=Arundo donax TaxID=35708 RepID=A0A0A9SCV9_ARUDO
MGFWLSVYVFRHAIYLLTS